MRADVVMAISDLDLLYRRLWRGLLNVD